MGAPALAEDTATQLEKVEITGSRIKRVDVEGPTPVTVITRDQIEKLGYTTVKDILGNLTVNAGGTFDTGQTFSFARGTQSIDLRGFGAGRTLILLDGRRLPVFPQGIGGTNAFVDLSTIPQSLVERVEILLDGASAVYGSDAISGVVNIITRKNVTGTEASARFSGTTGGGAAARRFQFLQGFSGTDTSVQIVGEYTHQNELRWVDRPYSASDFIHGGRGSSFGSSFLDDNGDVTPDPNCGTPNDALGGQGIPTSSFCRFDRAKYRQWQPETDKGSLYLRFDRRLGPVNAYSRFGYYRGRSNTQLEPIPYQGGESGAFISDRIIPNSAFDPVNGPGYVADGAPNDPNPGDGVGGFFFRRLVEFGPRGQDMTTEGLTGLVGVGGNFAGLFNWDFGISHNEVRITVLTPTLLSSVFDNEVSNNGLDLFQPIPTAVVQKTQHIETESGVSRNTAFDGTLSGPLGFSVWGGPAQFAFHTDYVREAYSDVFDPITTQGDVTDGNNGGGGRRTYYGVGLELSFPLIDTLELGLAGRYDRYIDSSAVGGAFSPSAHIGYRPIKSLLLRASGGKSFRAPDLQRLFGATTAGFDTVIDSVRCRAAGGQNGTPVDANNPDDPCLPIQSVPATAGSNPNLKEETGRNFNTGFSWEVVNNLNLTGDYFQIHVDDIVSNISSQGILDACASTGAFCGNIRRAPDGTLGLPSAGGDNRALISATAQNLASQEVRGLDWSASYLYVMGKPGRLRSELKWSHLTSVLVRSQPDAPLLQQLGNNDFVVLPKDRYSFQTDWDMAMVGATARVDRIGKYAGGQATANEVQPQDFTKAFTTVNLQVRGMFGRYGTLRLGVDNVFNEDFTIDPTFTPGTPGVQNQYLGEATSFYSNPYGRVGYVQYELKF